MVQTKLFSDLYLAKFYILAKSFFPCRYSYMAVNLKKPIFYWLLHLTYLIFY